LGCSVNDGMIVKRKLAILFLALAFAAVLVAVPAFAAPVEEVEVEQRTWVLDGRIASAQVRGLGRVLVVDGTVTRPDGNETAGTFLFLWRQGVRRVIRLDAAEFHWSMETCELKIDREKISLYLTWNTRSPTSKVHRETSNDKWCLTIDGSGRLAGVRGSIEFPETERGPWRLFGRGCVLQGSVVMSRL